MAPFTIDEKSTLALAIEKFRLGLDEEAAALAEAALEEAQEPAAQAASAFVAGVARLWNCHHSEAYGECSLASDHFEAAKDLAWLCSPQDACAELKQEAQIWGKATQIVSEKLEKKLGEALEKIDPDEVSYRPNNLHLPGFEIKQSKLLTKLSHFDPPLNGVHYVPLEVYETFDLENGEWVSSVEEVTPYRRRVPITHSYEGWLIPRGVRFIFYNSADSILALPVPDGFSVDAAHVEIDGSRAGFDLLESSDGILYAKLKEGSFGPLKIRFEMGPGGRQSSPSVKPATRKDLLGDVSLPNAVTELFSRTQFMGAPEIYAETFKLVREMVGYPTDGDILSGRAIFEADDAKEFFSKIWKMELADCDVANTLGIALLRRQGVAARLVTGYLIQDSGVGLHGWLEFFDLHRKEWVPGDMTPPLTDAIPNTRDARRSSDTTSQNDVVAPKKTSHPFRMTKHKEKPAHIDGPVDRFWTFRGNKMVISKPDGRYIVTLSENRDKVVAYDLEKERSISLPVIYPNIPHDAAMGSTHFEPIDENWEAYETPEGLMVELNANFIVDEGSGKPYLSWTVLEGDPNFKPDFSRDTSAYQNPKVTENKIYFTKFSKVVALLWPKDNPDTYAFHIDSYREGSQGEVRALVQEVVNRTGQSSLNKHYLLRLKPPQSKVEWLNVTREMLGTPFCEEDDYNLCPIDQSPDGSHFAVYQKLTQNTGGLLTDIGMRLRVFRGDQEKYHFSRPSRGCDVVACAVRSWREFRVNNDGSVVIKEQDRNSIRTLNLDENGAHQFEKDRLWQAEDETYGKDLLLYKFDEKGEVLRAGRLSFRMQVKDFIFKKIAWDGSWISSGGVLYQQPELFHQYDSGGEIFSKDLRDAVDFCADRHGIVCLGSHEDGRYVVKMKWVPYFDPEISLPQNWTDGRAWSDYNFQPTLHEVGESLFWEGGIEQLDGFRNTMKEEVVLKTEPYAGIVHRREERVSYLLREFLKDYEASHLFPPSEGLRLLLGRVAANPDLKVFHEWLLIGAARLFESETACLGSESPECGRELRAAANFREENGHALADRFVSHLRESNHFSNRTTIVDAWALHLLSKPALFKEMLTENPSLAAEAVFKIVEKGMFDPRHLPKMPREVEAKLTAALKVLLTSYRDRLYRQMEQTQPVMWTHRLETYQHLCQTLAKRFSPTVIPTSSEQDW